MSQDMDVRYPFIIIPETGKKSTQNYDKLIAFIQDRFATRDEYKAASYVTWIDIVLTKTTQQRKLSKIWIDCGVD